MIIDFDVGVDELYNWSLCQFKVIFSSCCAALVSSLDEDEVRDGKKGQSLCQ